MSVNSYPILTSDEAALLIKDGDTVSFSGFSPAGAAKGRTQSYRLPCT